MKKSKNIVLSFILGSISVLSFGQTKNFIDQPFLETQITVDTLVAPDLITLEIALDEKDAKNRKSVEQLERAMLTALKGLGINIEKQLSLNDLSSNFKFYALRKTGVLKTKHYSLEVYKASEASQVIRVLEEKDISNVNLAKTEFTNKDQIYDMLIEKAVEKGKKKANKALNTLNQKCGKILNIIIEPEPLSDTNRLRGQVAGVVIRGYSSVQHAEKIDSSTISFEKIKITQTINIKFAIQ